MVCTSSSLLTCQGPILPPGMNAANGWWRETMANANGYTADVASRFNPNQVSDPNGTSLSVNILPPRSLPVAFSPARGGW